MIEYEFLQNSLMLTWLVRGILVEWADLPVDIYIEHIYCHQQDKAPLIWQVTLDGTAQCANGYKSKGQSMTDRKHSNGSGGLPRNTRRGMVSLGLQSK